MTRKGMKAEIPRLKRSQVEYNGCWPIRIRKISRVQTDKSSCRKEKRIRNDKLR